MPSYIGTITGRALFVYEPLQQVARAIDGARPRGDAAPQPSYAAVVSSKWSALTKQVWTFIRNAFGKDAA